MEGGITYGNLFLMKEDKQINVTLNCDNNTFYGSGTEKTFQCYPTEDVNWDGEYTLSSTMNTMIGSVCTILTPQENSYKFIIEGLACEAKVESDITIKTLNQTDSIPVTITCEEVITGSVTGLILEAYSLIRNLNCDDIPATTNQKTNTINCSPARDITNAYTISLSKSDNAKIGLGIVLNIAQNSKSIVVQGISVSCKAKIPNDIKKKTLYKSDSKTVTITNLGDETISGGINGLSLCKSGTEMNICLSCDNLPSTPKDASNDINCKPTSEISNIGTYSLYINYGTQIGISPLTLDDDSKNLIISDIFNKGLAKIDSDLTKKSLTTTDTITITIKNDGEEQDILSGEIGGLSLFSSSGEDISLTCNALSSTSPGKSNTITCSPISDLTTAETFTLKASNFAYIISDENLFNLSIDENSKTLTINPDYREDSNVSNDSNDSNDSNNDTSGSYNNKFSSLLLICAGLLL